jgi:putative Holliday junction resolvase
VAVAVIASATPAGTVLAFDYGTKKIGVAIGETSVGVAHPLTTIAGGAERERFEAIRSLVEEWRPVLFVVGLPSHADGKPHAMTARALRFARQLEARFGQPVVCSDERFTTQAAAQVLRAASARRRRRSGARDQVAAQLILQDYLDRRAAT